MSQLRTCDDLRPLLGGYVLGALEPDEAEAVREHLPGCAACSAEHASLAGLPALLDLATPLAAPDEPLSPAFEEALLDRLARDRESAAPGPAAKPSSPWLCSTSIGRETDMSVPTPVSGSKTWDCASSSPDESAVTVTTRPTPTPRPSEVRSVRPLRLRSSARM